MPASAGGSAYGRLRVCMDMALPGETTVSGGQRGRLVLLAKNARGYRSLCYIASWLQGDPRRETRLRQGLAWELLAEHREGLLCIEGGQSGWLFNLLRAGREGVVITPAPPIVEAESPAQRLAWETHILG